MGDKFAEDRSVETEVARRRKAAQCQLEFSEPKQTAASNRRRTQPGWKAAQMAKIMSSKNDLPAKIEMRQSTQPKC
jgi:hypothetical protein